MARGSTVERPSIWHVIALLGAVLVGTTLYRWGQPLICTCGDVTFWGGSIHSPQNSQQIADWYTLSHVVHGMLVVVLWRWWWPALPVGVPYAAAIATGAGWEIVEHTEWVLAQFREATLYKGYRGDTVVNSVADYLWMLGGFHVARAFWNAGTLVLVAGLEAGSALIGRDSLVISTLMLIHPVDAVEQWQEAVAPQER